MTSRTTVLAMGRLRKTFVAKVGKTKVKGKALIDTGSDKTTISVADACRLGLDKQTAEPVVGVGVRGGRVRGYFFEGVEVRIGKRKARLTVVATDDTNPTVGHDFLQRSGAKLDYEQPHREVFSGVRNVKSAKKIDPKEGGLQFRRVFGKEAAAVRRAISCPTGRRKKR